MLFPEEEQLRPDAVASLPFVRLLELMFIAGFILGVIFATVFFFGLHFFFGLLVYLPSIFRCSVCHHTPLSTLVAKKCFKSGVLFNLIAESDVFAFMSTVLAFVDVTDFEDDKFMDDKFMVPCSPESLPGVYRSKGVRADA